MFQLAQGQYLTYRSDIKPIIGKKCAGCHQAGDIGPMPLTNYAEVSAYGSKIQYVTSTRQMPPWYADTAYSHFINERVLSRDEIQTIKDWVDNGMIEGAEPYGQVISSAASVTVVPRKPELILSMSEPFAADSRDLDHYRVFVIPTQLEEDKWVEGIEFVPGNKKIVRHASISVAPSGSFDSLDRWDPRYGYYSFGGLAQTPDLPHWYTWSPQQRATYYPEGMGKFLPKGSDLVLHMHYGPNDIPQDDSSQIRLYFTSKKITQPVITAPLINPYGLTNGTLYIPANTRKTFHAQYTIPYPIHLQSLTPQGNLLCRSWDVYATVPGQPQPHRLLKIRDWNFNWKQTYRFVTPVFLPEGAVLHTIAVYDNTLDNPHHPADKPKEVTWGASPYNELFFVHAEFIPEPIPVTDIQLASAVVTDGPLMPVTIDVERKGYYLLEVVNPVDRSRRKLTDLNLEKGKHTVQIPVSDLNNGNYLIEVFDAEYSLVARQMFVKMWSKGM